MQGSGPSAQRWQLFLSLAILSLLVVVAIARGQPRPETPYDLDSAGSSGLRALRLWLGEMGYTVERATTPRFRLPDPPAILFIYPNELPYENVTASTLRLWVRRGGTAVIVGPALHDTALANAFGVETAPSQSLYTSAVQDQPLLPEADAGWLHLSGRALDLSGAIHAVPVLTNDGGEVLAAVQTLGDGAVWHLAPGLDFTNDLLREPNNARLLLAILRTAPEGSTILFDTYHLFGPEDQPTDQGFPSLQSWLYGTPQGWAILFVAGAIVLYLALQGVRLGPPLPAAGADRRREAAEFVEAMASLQRRARHRTQVAHHHKQRLKIALGRPLHISPDLPDAEFLHRLQAADHQLTPEQAQQVAELLNGLTGEADEATLVRLVAKLDDLLKETS